MTTDKIDPRVPPGQGAQRPQPGNSGMNSNLGEGPSGANGLDATFDANSGGLSLIGGWHAVTLPGGARMGMSDSAYELWQQVERWNARANEPNLGRDSDR